MNAFALRLTTGERDAQSSLAPASPQGLCVADQFAALWAHHDVSWRPGSEPKHFNHPEVGALELECESLVAESDSQILLVYTAAPGTESADRLRLLGVLGNQQFTDVTTAAPVDHLP